MHGTAGKWTGTVGGKAFRYPDPRLDGSPIDSMSSDMASRVLQGLVDCNQAAWEMALTLAQSTPSVVWAPKPEKGSTP